MISTDRDLGTESEINSGEGLHSLGCWFREATERLMQGSASTG